MKWFHWVGLVIFAGLVLAAAVGTAVSLAAWQAYTEEPREDAARLVWIPAGTSTGEAARLLKDKEVLEPGLSTLTFRVAARLRDADHRLKAGEYDFPPSAAPKRVLDQLIEGPNHFRAVTIPEGRTSAQVAAIINAEPMLTGEAVEVPPEGSVLPETYAFERGESRQALLQRMKDAQDLLLDEAWPKRDSDLPFDTRDEAIILASIVEKETAVPGERDVIAGVFENRLRTGMRLQSDPTVIYGLTQGEPLGRGLRRSELRKKTPYNTYRRKGLPPTPIANPGRASILAVLNPADTDALFFVADGSGGHAFATTYDEHRENVQAWRRVEAERRRGG